MKKVLLVLAGVVLLSIQGSAAVILVSDVGTFSSATDMRSYTFTLAAPSDVIMRTWGWAGGTNLNGVVIPAGGFDPILSLYRLDTNAQIAQNDDGGCANVGSSAGLCWDAFIHTYLAAGNYGVVLSVFNNFPTGNFFPTGAGTPSFSGRTTNYAVDLSGVPEPVTMALFGSGLLALGFVRRFRRS
ncbi:MAG: DVUA0089 family protein [Bryobacterales bacterium]|nr:DVUA0089 family protein [Bryobacterales bacterium]